MGTTAVAETDRLADLGLIRGVEERPRLQLGVSARTTASGHVSGRVLRESGRRSHRWFAALVAT